MMMFNSLDYIIAAILILSVIVGFFRGFLREVISLVTWFLAFIIALKFSPTLSHSIEHMAGNQVMHYILCAVGLFLLVLIIGVIINKSIHVLVTASGLGLLDRLLGLVFGAARGVLFVVIVLLIVSESSYQQSPWYQQSQLAPHFQPIVARFAVMIPKDMRIMTSWISQINKTKIMS